jgi:hypothetical protein
MEEVKERRTVIISPANYLSREDLHKWAKNILWFTAPAVAIFFAQLAMGVEPKAAATVALLAFYGIVADFFKKYKSETVRLSE